MLRLCSCIGCKHKVRSGLVRSGLGSSGQPLSDGVFCWRCRQRERRRKPRTVPSPMKPHGVPK